MSLSLPQCLPSERFNHTLYGELLLSYVTVEEKNLDFLPCDQKEQMETPSKMLYVGIPYVSNGDHGLLTLVELTSRKNLLTPSWETNDKYRINVDVINEDEEKVSLRIGNDEMTLDVSKNTSCHTDVDVGKDFDHVYGGNVTVTNYPQRMDWSCGSVLDWNTGYCRILKDNLCDIRRYDGDICVHAIITSSVRCPTHMKVTSVHGIFRDILWGMFNELPAVSFETEWIDRDHDVGIKFPCLTFPVS